MVQAAGKVLVVGTSLGQIIVLSVHVLEQIGVTTNTSGGAVSSGEGEDNEEEEGESVVSIDCVMFCLLDRGVVTLSMADRRLSV